VQPYNTLLSMAALAEVSSGMLLLQNEALHATCTRLLGIKHPGFKVRRGLLSVCLSHVRCNHHLRWYEQKARRVC
jgi:tubulin delta